MLRLVDKDGKPIQAEGVDPKTAAYIEAVVGGIGHQMTAAVAATLKPIGERITGFETTLNEIKAAKPEVKPPEPDPKTQPDPNAMPEWAKKMNDNMAKLEATLNGRDQEQRTLGLANAWLDKNRPGLKPEQRKAVLAAIVAGKPDTDEKVGEIFAAKQAEYAAIFGKDNAEKAFTASVEAEGGAAARAVKDAEAAEKTRIEGLNTYMTEARK